MAQSQCLFFVFHGYFEYVTQQSCHINLRWLQDTGSSSWCDKGKVFIQVVLHSQMCRDSLQMCVIDQPLIYGADIVLLWMCVTSVINGFFPSRADLFLFAQRPVSSVDGKGLCRSKCIYPKLHHLHQSACCSLAQTSDDKQELKIRLRSQPGPFPRSSPFSYRCRSLLGATPFQRHLADAS